jgi:hypothetical protein
MPYGLPDSWGAWAAKRVFKGLRGSGARGYRGGLGGGSSTHYSYKFQKLVLYKPVLDTYLKTSKGPLWGALSRRGKIVVALAKRQVGVETGALRNSIKMEHKTVRYGQELRIGSKNKIAYLHHEGTKPHLITPKDAPQLVFMSKGRVIRTQLVRHPGTKPNRYLSDQLYIFQDLGSIYTGKSFPKVK